ncbi:hypothetical protein [Mariniblastus fucicola]|uniref:Uncharacterized protein n=1 Tax=Mariniblastus fucicola TaxID=980251 RepID=A0A5B9PGX3_9BACT|nr:hypothetical protein [Mariniblastus fucicola]QEG24849.1 hypothetical protein MFFC18_47720 [Mariniblastus fucicola]
MSVDTFLFVREQLPTVSEWQTALDAAGLKVKLDPEVDDLPAFTGYLPAVLTTNRQASSYTSILLKMRSATARCGR